MALQGRQVGTPGVTSTSSHATALEGLKSWPLLRRCIPDADDGETLTLAIETPLVGFGVLTWAATEAGAILHRRLACVVREWVQPALVRSGVMRVGTAQVGHRRNGEIVSLQDKAWRLWCAHAGDIEALAEAPLWVNCLPDDLDQNGLHLATTSHQARTAMVGQGGESLASVLGIPIIPQTLYCLDQVLVVRLGINGGRAETPDQAKAREALESTVLAWLIGHMETPEQAREWLAHWTSTFGRDEAHRRLQAIIEEGPTGKGLNERMTAAAA